MCCGKSVPDTRPPIQPKCHENTLRKGLGVKIHGNNWKCLKYFVLVSCVYKILEYFLKITLLTRFDIQLSKVYRQLS